MDGFSAYRTVLCGVGSRVWWRVAAWVMGRTQARLGKSTAQTNCFVDDPIIPLQGTTKQRRLCSLGLKLAYEKVSFGPDAEWIGTHLRLDSVVNKLEVRLPTKKNRYSGSTPKYHGQLQRYDQAFRCAQDRWKGKMSCGFLAAVEIVCAPFAGQLVQGSYGRQSGLGVQEANVASSNVAEKVSRTTSTGVGQASPLGGSLAGWAGAGSGRHHSWWRSSLSVWRTQAVETRTA